jgi:hypothetical protein
MIDTIDGANMTKGSLVSNFVSDRFGQANAALNLNGGWTQCPSTKYYFYTSQFSISLWIYPSMLNGEWARVFDFGSVNPLDDIFLSICEGTQLTPTFAFYQGGNLVKQVSSLKELALNQWNYLVATFDGTSMNIYINALLTGTALASYAPLTITRTQNYFGKSNWGADGYSSSCLDDVKFYSLSLSQVEINEQFIVSGSFKIGSENLFEYLTHYWPIDNGEMIDVIGGANMQQGSGGASVLFLNDRFGNANAALGLNGGFAQVPAGIYFNYPMFTVSVWIYPQTVGAFARIIDFGNGISDNLVFTQSTGTDMKPYFQFINGNTWYPIAYSSLILTTSQWQFLAATYDGTTLRLYLNGILVGSSQVSYCLPTLTRVNNYIGKSANSPPLGSDGYSFSYLDDLRFYNISLSQSQIIDLMMSNDTYAPTSTTSTTTSSTSTSSLSGTTLSPCMTLSTIQRSSTTFMETSSRTIPPTFTTTSPSNLIIPQIYSKSFNSETLP